MVTLPTDAHAFISFMEHVWEGGELYDEWHDAMIAAKRVGMTRTGGTSTDGPDSRWWHVFRFPNANDGVLIHPSGDAIKPAKNRRN